MKKSGTGTVRHIVIRIGIKTNEVLLTLVVNNDDLKKYEEKFISEMTTKYVQIKSIVKNFNTENTNIILGKKCENIYGPGYIYDSLDTYKFKISALSFYQVNPTQTEILYNTALKFAQTGNIALDLYCGIGTIGIFASKNFKKIYGIEIINDAVNDAKENAKLNNIENMEFYAGDVEKVLLPILEKEKIKPDVVFIDPPRKGLDKNTISVLLRLKTEKIIYVSCNPATLARDISMLEDKYSVKQVQPVDMFPWTRAHRNDCSIKIKYRKNLASVFIINHTYFKAKKTRNFVPYGLYKFFQI